MTFLAPDAKKFYSLIINDYLLVQKNATNDFFHCCTHSLIVYHLKTSYFCEIQHFSYFYLVFRLSYLFNATFSSFFLFVLSDEIDSIILDFNLF